MARGEDRIRKKKTKWKNDKTSMADSGRCAGREPDTTWERVSWQGEASGTASRLADVPVCPKSPVGTKSTMHIPEVREYPGSN